MAYNQLVVPPTIVKNTFIEIAAPEEGGHGARHKMRRGHSADRLERSSFHKQRGWADMDDSEELLFGEWTTNTRSEGSGSESSCSMEGASATRPVWSAAAGSEDSDDRSELNFDITAAQVKASPLDGSAIRVATLTAKAAAEAHRSFLQQNPAALGLLFVGDFAPWCDSTAMQDCSQQMSPNEGEAWQGGDWQCPNCGVPKYHLQVNFCAFCGTRLS
mmetsp:Transcript_52521/g.97245  ORF Transcript_52521/g.97245 Transcript_52521/m.97245 type:complete len:217 (-) Transcript_52521:41-691(-)